MDATVQAVQRNVASTDAMRSGLVAAFFFIEHEVEADVAAVALVVIESYSERSLRARCSGCGTPGRRPSVDVGQPLHLGALGERLERALRPSASRLAPPLMSPLSTSCDGVELPGSVAAEA